MGRALTALLPCFAAFLLGCVLTYTMLSWHAAPFKEADLRVGGQWRKTPRWAAGAQWQKTPPWAPSEPCNSSCPTCPLPGLCIEAVDSQIVPVSPPSSTRTLCPPSTSETGKCPSCNTTVTTPKPPVPCHKINRCPSSIRDAQGSPTHPLQRPHSHLDGYSSYEPYFGMPYSTSDPNRIAELQEYLNHAHRLFQRRAGQMSFEQYAYVTQILFQATPCNVLVWGMGQDSGLWATINSLGRTTFLENSPEWIDIMRKTNPGFDAHTVTYKHLAKLGAVNSLNAFQANASDTDLLVSLPTEVADVTWDVILVDAPHMVRIESIWTTKRLIGKYCDDALGSENRCASKGGVVHVLVHDCDRRMERTWADLVFGADGYVLVEGFRKNNKLTQMRHYVFGSLQIDKARLRDLEKGLVATIA